MISNFIRKVFSFLSFWSLNNLKSIKKKDKKIIKKIHDKLNNIYLDNKNLKKTHNVFNKELLKLLKNGKIISFLRKNFIQKMFFVQNRVFIFNELNKLKKDKKWKFYKKLITEDNVGDPIRYFLYPKSSGNRINHVYHLSILINQFNLDIKKINNVFEFGAGYGCMARIFSKINKKISYLCFDTDHVNLLQFYYLKHNNLNVGFEKKNKFQLISNFDDIKNNFNRNKNLFIANWSLSETTLKFRDKFHNLILKSDYILICFQEKFEKTNNLIYFKKLKKKLTHKFDVKIINNQFYKGNFFNKQNHYFFVAKKN